jgi:type I restriction enzyme S subunit
MNNSRGANTAWRRVRFGDVVRLSKARCADPLAEGVERFVGLEHLEPRDLRIHTWGNVADGVTFTNVFKPGQVLFGKRRAYQRKVAVANFSGVCSGDIYVLESQNANVLIPELLPFICQTDVFFEHAVGTSAGSLSPRTNWTSLADFEFTLPPPDEQRRILEILEVADHTASALEDAKTHHDELLKAFIQEEFERFDVACTHIRASELMRKITVGIVVKPADLYVEQGKGVLALRSLNLFPDRFVLDETVQISVDGHAAHCKSVLQAGDIVIVRTGRPGDAAVVPPELDGINCIDLIVAKPGEEIEAQYVVTFLNSQFGRRIFSAGTTGTAQQHFNVGEFSKLRLPVPPRESQREFVSRLSAIRSPANALSERLNQVKAMRTSLLNRAVGDVNHGV